ncbi:MAG: hypothetical protein Q8940_06120 [Bacteroidota bacterium]|nr:hypothetical protein [Bacteroidota bacterium]
MESSEEKWLKDNQIRKLYLRVFDVDWNESIGQPLPIGDLQIKTDNLPQDIEVIPVVFITNRTFLNMRDLSVDTLAANVIKKVTSKMGGNFPNHKISEIQFDCDWTENTRDKYFRFINAAKSVSKGNVITATIRLHQVKYFHRTGVPPVERGMLMFYNMSSVENLMIKNSIFETETAKKYLYNFDKYPLRLDVVLPAFSWASLFRKGKLIGLINELSSNDLRKCGKFKEENPNQFICTSSTVISGIQIVENDFIRIESISSETTETAAKLASEHIRKNNNITVALFHLNKEVVNKYEKTKLENIYSCFN